MLYRRVPKTGDELSILGFGCMRLAQQDGRIDEERATRQIRRAIDQGVNYVETAWVVQKRDDMDRFLDAQLEKLETSHIDYYLVHSVNGATWDNVAALGVRDFLDRARVDGRIVNVGFSFHGIREDFGRIVDAYPWEFCQIQYNYLDEENQAGTEGLKYAASKGLAVIVMEPLRGGALAAAPPPAVGTLWRQADSRRSPAEWALRWVWNHPEVTLLLSGMNNEEAQVEENLRVASDARAGALTLAEVALIGAVGRKYRELMKVGCTGCGYCQPCPSGVNIPECFTLFNAFHTFGKQKEAAFLYVVRMGGVLTGKPGYASLCSHCQDCVQKCPQGLDVPTFLEQVVDEFERDGLADREAAVRGLFAS
jgi:uncharacterized protein